VNVLEVRGLRISAGGRELVGGVDLDVAPGECVALVGESGAGKSLTARALLGLLPPGIRARSERLRIRDVDARRLSPREWRRVRGASIALVSQDALVSLDPLRRVGAEVAEPLRIHDPRLRGAALRERVLARLRDVAMPEPERRALQRPHELSGGLRQRALIASALAAGPAVLVADEPTTALDATVQARVLAVLRRIADDGMAVVFISHDLAAVAKVADRVVVLQDGAVVEAGSAAEVLERPRHAYTRALVAANSSAALDRPPVAGAPILTAQRLVRRFDDVVAVDAVSLSLHRGRTLAVVGESGSGKTTLARMLAGIESADSGAITFAGSAWDPRIARGARRSRVQLVPQNPLGALDPRWSVRRTLREAFQAAGVARSERDAAVDDILREVGLDPALAARRPAALSGGQRQRAAIARALAVRPDLLLLDEPVSALDTTVRQRVLERLRALQAERDLAMVFITHDLEVVAGIADHVLVMRDGRVVEEGRVNAVFGAPRHPFTRELLAASSHRVPRGGRPA
jgi:peptide/nickel transport system ATP-binding protein